MMKKILAVLMAVLFAFGVMTVAVSAEEEPEKPAYVPVEHKIETIIQTIDAGEEYYLMPTDTIVLPVSKTEEPTKPADQPAAAAEGEAAYADVLIVEYTAGDGAESLIGMTKYTDWQKSGYAVKAIGDYTDYAYKNSTRNTEYPIDFAHEKEYAFKQWKVTSVYSGKEFSRVTVEAVWDVPVLHGWAGWQTMRRAYIRTFIDTLFAYITAALGRLAGFLV